MPTKIHNTGITFPDNTTQTTAGAAADYSQYAIGSYIFGRPLNVTSYNNATIAGSSLYATSGAFAVQGASEDSYGPMWASSDYREYVSTSLVNTGSWRCVSIAGAGRAYNAGQYQYADSGTPGLWVRYA